MAKFSFGVVNNYFLLSKCELEKLKANVTKEDIEYLKDIFSDSICDYESDKRSVIYTKRDYKSVDQNDYVSLSPYWWPDPQKEDGLPYIRRDGEENPEASLYDKSDFRKLGFDIYHLSLLYYLTEDRQYYNIMKKNIYYYLLDSKTGMNPNMDHAQTVKGQDNGRCYGIIEYSANVSFAFYLLNQIYLMGYVEEEFKNDLNVWVRKFYEWMTQSSNGKKERDGNNNHAIYWDLGTIILCDFLQDDTLIKEMYDRVVLFRVKAQISEEGSMPFELARTRSKFYSTMALKGLLNFSNISSRYGYDLFEDSECKTILTTAVDYIYDRLIFETKPWVYRQINKFDIVYFLALMNEASKKIDVKYKRLDLIKKEDVVNEISYFIATKIF